MKKTLTLNNGVKMPVIGLGTWKANRKQVGVAVRYAIEEAGYRHIDCASIYGNEKEIGVAFKQIFSGSKVKRAEVFVTSKLWNTDHDPKTVEASCRQTLQDLQLDYLDLYLVHWGIAFQPKGDKEPVRDGRVVTEPVSTQATWQAMEELVKKGLVKSIGVANFTTTMLIDLLTYAKIKPAVNQIELHPYNSQQPLVDFCQHHQIQVTAYSPLGSSGLTRKGRPRLLDDPKLKKIAQTHGKTPAQILLRWGIERQTIVIPKSTKNERVEENINIFDFKLTKQETEEIDALNRNHRFVNPIDWWGVPYFD